MGRLSVLTWAKEGATVLDHTAYRTHLAPLAGTECAFPKDELQARQQALLRAMDGAGLDAMLITSPGEIFWLTGYSTFEVSVHTALLFAPDRLVIQVPSIETGPAVACTHVDDIRGYRWESVDDVVAPLADAMAGLRRLGLDPWQASLRPGILDRLRTARPELEIVDSAGLIPGLRIVKSPAEIACLEESARMTEAGMRAALAAARPGGTDSAVAAAAAEAMHAAGSEFMSMQPIVTTGHRSSVIHMNHKRVEIAPGDPVFVELGGVYNRYTAPMMQTVVAGDPTDRMRAVFDTCRRIYDALCTTMTPGRSFGEAAHAARSAMAAMDADVFHSGVFAYAVGAQFPPSWVEGTGYVANGIEREFECDMVFHLPICLRLPGAWGIGCSDTVRVTNDGAVPLTRNSWSLDQTG